MIRRWFILGVLAAVMVSLLWYFYTEVVVYHAMDAVTKSETAAEKPREKIPSYEPAWDSAIVEKNLFSKARGYTPPPPPPPPGAAIEPLPPPVPPELSLNGIILDQYGEFVAYIQKDKGKAQQVRKGDSFDGIQVVDISPREVNLLWNGEEINLSMKKIKTMSGTVPGK